MNDEVRQQRAVLIQKALASKGKGEPSRTKKDSPGFESEDFPYSCSHEEEGH